MYTGRPDTSTVIGIPSSICEDLLLLRGVSYVVIFGVRSRDDELYVNF